MSEIPKKVTNTDDKGGRLSQSVAEMSQEIKAPEASPYVISFAKYNDKMCELAILENNKAKKIIEILKTVGTKVCSMADFQRYFTKRISIKREGEYKKLFRSLEDDIELKEIKLQQSARVFYFDIESERTFYVVAITKNHLETDKVRR